MTTTSGKQILKLAGLRFSANLGILASEKLAPQAIEVNADLCLGAQPLLPQLRSVLGVRVKLAKLEIFDDCEVSIDVEAGQW